MALQVAQDWRTARYRFADPSVLLSCDNPQCQSAWLTGDGVLCWAVSRTGPEQSLFVDRLLFACNSACLEAAQEAGRWRKVHWSEPCRISQWLQELATAIATDPAVTEVGNLRSSN